MYKLCRQNVIWATYTYLLRNDNKEHKNEVCKDSKVFTIDVNGKNVHENHEQVNVRKTQVDSDPCDWNTRVVQ